MKLECLKIKKASEDIRGTEFTDLYMRFVDFLTPYLEGQASYYIAHAENNPQMFATVSGSKVITKSSIDFIPDIPIDPDTVNKLWEFLIASHLLGQVETTIQVIGSLEIDNPLATRYATNRSMEMVKWVGETTRTQMRELFARSFTESWTMFETVQAIVDDFGFSPYRAALIAHMETATAYEVGKAEQFSKYANMGGLIWWKRSITQHDSVVRPEHTQNEDDGWIPNSQPFSGTQTDYAPHGFNCRCVVVRSLIDPDMMP